MKKYIEIETVQELVRLYKKRDCFHDWTSEWDKYNKKIENTISWLERNAKTKDELGEV